MTSKRYDMVKILIRVSGIISSSLNLDKVVKLILSESMKAMHADHASLFLMGDSMKHLSLAGAKGFSRNEMDNIKLLGGWEVIKDQLVLKKKALVVNDVDRNGIFKKKKLPFLREMIPVKSFLAVPLEKDGSIAGVLIVSNKKRPGHLFTKEDKRLLEALSNHIAIALLNAKLYHKLNSLFISTVKSLTKAIDAKDRYTSGHSERVMKYSCAIGRELNLAEEVMEYLRLSSLLHDVGKIGIKENILSKPSKLLFREKAQMNRHPVIGAGIVENIDDVHKIIRGVLEHHERFDGKGYPNGLKGRQISLEGRIIAVADVFDALTTNRSYHKKHSPREAFLAIQEGSSRHFDPEIVKAFTESFSKYPMLWMT